MDNSLRGLAVLRVLRHPALLRLWLAQVIYLSVQFTASYAMIVLITDETHSATMVGLVIIALSLPLVLLGAQAGTLVDRMDRRRVLWVSNVVRALATALFVVALLFDPHQYLFIYVLAFFFSLVGLFFSPAEGAIIPRLVGKAELLPALSLYNLTLNLSQAVGLLLFGPLALDLLPSVALHLASYSVIFTPVETLFAGITILYLIAAGLTRSLPSEHQLGPQFPAELMGIERERAEAQASPIPGQESPDGGEGPLAGRQRMRKDLREGLGLVWRDGVLLDSLFQACFGGLIMLTIAELATTFVQRLLNLPTSDTALIFAPAGVGLVAGSLLVPMVVARLGSTRTMVVGMIGTAIGIGLLPIAQWVSHVSGTVNQWTNALFLLIVGSLTAMVGLSLDLIIVPAQARVQERSPDEMRGRVLALYQVLFNGFAIPVMLFMGALTDLLGIVVVIYIIVASNIGAIFISVIRALGRKPGDSDRGSSGGRGHAEQEGLFSEKREMWGTPPTPA